MEGCGSVQRSKRPDRAVISLRESFRAALYSFPRPHPALCGSAGIDPNRVVEKESLIEHQLIEPWVAELKSI
jgi:hypothetical protein